MTRTQIQLPERLYERTKAFADDREVSMAEVFRNAIELYIMVYDDTKTGGVGRNDWEMPVLDVELVNDPFASSGWRGGMYEKDSIERLTV